jgi:hypothetical protein
MRPLNGFMVKAKWRENIMMTRYLIEFHTVHIQSLQGHMR